MDDPESDEKSAPNIVPPNSKRRRTSDLDDSDAQSTSSSHTGEAYASAESMEIDELLTRLQREEEDEEEEVEDDEERSSEEPQAYHPGVPVIKPRRRYTGARNVDTIKDGTP